MKCRRHGTARNCVSRETPQRSVALATRAAWRARSTSLGAAAFALPAVARVAEPHAERAAQAGRIVDRHRERTAATRGARERTEQQQQRHDRRQLAQRVGREIAVLEPREAVHREARQPGLDARELFARARRHDVVERRCGAASADRCAARLVGVLGRGRLRGRHRGRGGGSSRWAASSSVMRGAGGSGCAGGPAGARLASARLAIASAHRSVSATTRERFGDMKTPHPHRSGEAAG